jgi:hypothetical protein
VTSVLLAAYEIVVTLIARRATADDEHRDKPGQELKAA